MDVLRPPEGHALLLFALQVALLLASARLLGGLAKRFGQPTVVGELAAGLLLGPSVLGKLAPGLSEWLFPSDVTQGAMLGAVAWLGVMFLLVVTGFETDLGLVRRFGRAAALVASGSLLLPFAAGVTSGAAMPQEFLGPSATRGTFALFLATALSVSALPVIAKILRDLDLIRRNFGQLTLAAGMANDVVGWFLLGVIAGAARDGEFAPATLLLGVVGLVVFVVFAFTIGQTLADKAYEVLRRRGSGVTGGLTFTICAVLVCGAYTQAIGVEAVIGAFVAGIVLGRCRFRQVEVRTSLETFVAAFLAPIFFATAGLQVDLGLLGRWTVLGWGVAVVVLASASKFLGSFLGARAAGLGNRDGAALGVGLNARGAVEIVIATVGLALGILNGESYTIVVLMAITTTLMTPPLLRRVVRGWRGEPEEQQRLDREESHDRNVLVKPGGALLLTRGGRGSMLAAQLLDLCWPIESRVTLLSVGSGRQPPVLHDVRAVFKARDVVSRHVVSDDVARAVVGQTELGYAVVAIAVGGVGDSGLGHLPSEVMAGCGVPIFAVRPGRGRGPDVGRADPRRWRRVLVPVEGTRSSRAALEVALHLAQTAEAEVWVVHVVSPSGDERHDEVAERMLRQAVSVGAEMRVRVADTTYIDHSVSDAIATAAEEERADLVVVGANLREVGGHPFLGHAVEALLEALDTDLLIVARPDA